MISTACRRAEDFVRVSRSHDSGAVDPGPFTFAQASRWSEVRGAFSLLYRNYLSRGLIPPDGVGLRYTHFNLLPESATFVASEGGQVVATFSLIPDTRSFGLPMDALYAKELAALRPGRRPAEISGLAVAPSYESVTLLLILNLVRMMYAYAQRTGITDLVVACHPRHARLYARLFRFEELGPLRTYRAVNDAPAVALRLDIETAEERYREAFGEGQGLHGFLFRQRTTELPWIPLRVGAMDTEAIRQLLTLRPEMLDLLEAGEPGLAARISGWHVPTARRFLENAPTAGWFPAFVPA
ncbi:MAG: hypothetical protein GXP50_09650 [Deltaproteobacteria bacterium]|nr:hypothetical protein [Deltaproteobacteria bacterium]